MIIITITTSFIIKNFKQKTSYKVIWKDKNYKEMQNKCISNIGKWDEMYEILKHSKIILFKGPISCFSSYCIIVFFIFKSIFVIRYILAIRCIRYNSLYLISNYIYFSNYKPEVEVYVILGNMGIRHLWPHCSKGKKKWMDMILVK